MNITILSPQQLRSAGDIKEKLDALQEQLNEIVGTEIPTRGATEAPAKPKNGRRKRRKRMARIESAPELATTAGPVRRKRRKLSPEGRPNIIAAQKARWAAKNREAQSETAPATEEAKPKKKRNISAAGRKAMSQGAKRRWAARRAAKNAKP